MAHAILSASGAHRWLSCPPSAMLERGFPEETSSYASEGTLAHALAELRLTKELTNLKPGVYKRKLEALQSNEMYTAGMADHVERYVDHVVEKFMAAVNSCSDSLILLEQKLDYSKWVPKGFGTGDVIIIGDDTLEICDLKYGKGVPVSAEGNPQTRLYGLGAINTFGMLYDFSKVRMTIVQPRLDNVSSEEMTVEELLTWAEEYVKPRAALAIKGEGGFCAGEHCKFCRARYTCRARADANMELAKYDFRDPPLLQDDEISAVLIMAESLQSWVSDIKAYALDQAENHGKKWPGWKLVEGRSNRKYTDEEAVAKVLLEAGYAEEKIYAPREIFGITAMEKNIGRKVFRQLLSELVIKPAGKPTLVPESDPRPEINSVKAAQEDFKNKEDI
jgi:hypothetical protein